jgi:hypothetical protein
MRIICLLLLVAGCGAPEGQSVGEIAQAIGEPNGTFPSAAERLGLMAINRARSDPATVKGAQSAMYPARPPVQWSYAFNRSARFHATNLELGNVTLMHTSPCTLNTNVAMANCSGDPACACMTPVPQMCAKCANVQAINNCGTDTFTRIGYFTANTGDSASGEVAAAGYGDPLAVVDGWMDEAAGADGHRRNLTDQGITSNVMGYGHAAGQNCWSTFDVSDSGNEGGLQAVKIPTAAVSPSAGNAGSHVFYATWADPALGTPASINVVVDGVCTAMTRELGTDKLNATYKATVNVAAGCHNYWILARDANNGRVTYPTTGAVTISVGQACAMDYLAQAPVANCDNMPPPQPDLAMNGPLPDLAGTPPRDLAGRDLTGAPKSDGSGGGNMTDDGGDGGELMGGCSCSVGARKKSGAEFALLLLAIISSARAIRRRSRSRSSRSY